MTITEKLAKRKVALDNARAALLEHDTFRNRKAFITSYISYRNTLARVSARRKHAGMITAWKLCDIRWPWRQSA